MPAARDPDERVLRLRELVELFVGELGVADGEPPVELERATRSRAARSSGSSGRARLDAVRFDAEPARRAHPRAPAAAPARRCSSSCGITSRRKRPTASASSCASVALRAVEVDAVLGEQRLELREPLHESRVAGRSRAGTRRSSPPSHSERRRQAERRIVLGLQPQLEHDAPSPRSSRWTASRHDASEPRASAPSPSYTQRESCRSQRRVAGVGRQDRARAR